jgi:thimet oligopeptidase
MLNAQSDPLHIWVGNPDPATMQKWVDAHLQKQQDYIAEMLAVKGPRTIQNTLRPFDNANNELAIAGNEAYLMYAVGPKKELRDLGQALAQKVSEAATELSLNQDTYHALRALDLSQTGPHTRYYVQRTLLEYRLAGVDKDAATRARIKQLQDHATQISLTFGRNVQEHVNTVVVHNKSELDGLPTDYIARHPPAADGTITLTTDSPDQIPVMTYAKSDELRRSMYLAYNTRAYPQNKAVLLDLLQTRYELAKILGYSNWADLATADQMIGSATNMEKFLNSVDGASREPARREYAMILAFAQKQQPGLKSIPAYSAGYWNELYRRTAFDFDSQSVRPYFPFDRVQQGVLNTASKLFHVTFQRADVPVWDPSVTAWNVFDGDKQVGRFYLDMHPRDGKDKWFSEMAMVPGIRGHQMPEASLICNFPGGTPEDPGLMQYSDVVTFFHEFGHLMHEILGGQQQWSGVSGVSTERDFVEAPSQMLEEFFRDPAILQSFARNYKTGEVLPLDVIQRMNRASAFGRGSWVQAQLLYSSYALDVHDRAPQEVDLDAILHRDFTRFLPYSFVDGNRFYASFTHLTGYSSNYYTYLFDKVIAIDFFSQFNQKDLLSGDTAMRYRRAVLEPGGSEPGNELVKNFLGRPQNMTAFKTWIGEEFAAPATGK